ncbi:MAG: four helix bundle protein [Caldilineales bacterium]|nr:four helix bundle protein [Caldilineales bacterium]
MATAKRFEDLEVWQRARELANCVYDFSDEGLFSRDFSLRDQTRRAAVSIMSNIAEGFESRTQALFIDYLGRAKASAGELRAQLYLAQDRSYIDARQFERVYELNTGVSRQLYSLIRYLENQPSNQRFRENSIEYEV